MKKTLIVGDIHGEAEKLERLLAKAGAIAYYESTIGETVYRDAYVPHGAPRVVFVGDFCDRGPDTPGVLDILHFMMEEGGAKAVLGNHDKKLLKRLTRHLNNETPPAFNEEVENTLNQFLNSPHWYQNGRKWLENYRDTLENLPYFLELPCGTKIVHAYYDARAIDKPKKKQELKLYGPVDRNAQPREDGLPNRIPWWENYDGRNGKVIFGHYSPADTVQVYSEHAICVDTGVYKTGVLGGYFLETGECVYVK